LIAATLSVAGCMTTRSVGTINIAACIELWDRLQPGRHQPPHRRIAGTPEPVGAGLLAKASCPPAHSALTHRVRQQAGSYKGFVVPFHVLIVPTLCVGDALPDAPRPSLRR
jgi:hypothetical protein